MSKEKKMEELTKNELNEMFTSGILNNLWQYMEAVDRNWSNNDLDRLLASLERLAEHADFAQRSLENGYYCVLERQRAQEKEAKKKKK